MTRTRRSGTVSRRVLFAMAAALIPLIAGCEAGNNAPSLQWHPPTDGASAMVGGITISNAFVLGAPIGASLHLGQNAGVFLGLVNIGAPDRLLSIAAPGVARTVRLPGGHVTLFRQHAVLLTGPQPAITLQHLTRALTGGSVVRLVLIFQNAGAVTIHVPVMPMAQYYSTFSPAATPSPTNTPSPSTTTPKSSKHTGGSSSATPSPSPTSS